MEKPQTLKCLVDKTKEQIDVAKTVEEIKNALYDLIDNINDKLKENE